MILDPSGKPIASTRKTVLQIHLVDQQAMSSQPKTYALGFELDRPDRAVVAQTLSQIARTVMSQLDEIGFFAQESPRAMAQPDGHP